MMMTFDDLCAKIGWHPNFWDPTKLLTMSDSSGGRPGVFIAVSNRTGGKTYGIGQICMLYNKLTKGKFGLICQTQNDLGCFADGVLKGVMSDIYPNYILTEKISPTHKFSEIYMKNILIDESDDVTEDHIGYVFPLSAAYKLKNFSSNFRDCDILFFDEFQHERYLKNEVDKLVNLRSSIARGTSSGVRDVPVIMCSNSLSVQNPYFMALGMSAKIQPNTHFLRGDGYVMERFSNFFVAKAQRQDAFNRAFAASDELKCAIDNEWLNDDRTCVCKKQPDWGKSTYLYTLIDGEQTFGVRRYYDAGITYISRSVDALCKNMYAISIDGVENAPLLRSLPTFVILRDNFLAGKVRFSDLGVKNVILAYLL